MTATSSVEREQREEDELERLKVIREGVNELENRQKIAILMGKLLWTDEERKELKKLYHEMYSEEALRRLVVFNDEESKLKNRALSLTEEELGDALLR